MYIAEKKVKDRQPDRHELRQRATRVTIAGYDIDRQAMIYADAFEAYEARGIYSFPLYLIDQTKIAFKNPIRREAIRFSHLIDSTQRDGHIGHWLWQGAKSQNLPILIINQKRYNPVIGWAAMALMRLETNASEIAETLNPYRMCGERFCVNPRHWEFHDPRLPPSLPNEILWANRDFENWDIMSLPVCWNPPYWGGYERTELTPDELDELGQSARTAMRAKLPKSKNLEENTQLLKAPESIFESPPTGQPEIWERSPEEQQRIIREAERALINEKPPAERFKPEDFMFDIDFGGQNEK